MCLHGNTRESLGELEIAVYFHTAFLVLPNFTRVTITRWKHRVNVFYLVYSWRCLSLLPGSAKDTEACYLDGCNRQYHLFDLLAD